MSSTIHLPLATMSLDGSPPVLPTIGAFVIITTLVVMALLPLLLFRNRK
jgi:hypothetical protein